MTAVAESSATEETASDASYSADELPEEPATATLHHNRGSMPSSKEWHRTGHSILSCLLKDLNVAHGLFAVMLLDMLDCDRHHLYCQ